MSTHPYPLQQADRTRDDPTRADRTRIDWLDYAKGFGIILVVYGHVISGLSNAGVLQTISVASKQALDLSVLSIYMFHMPLFFFISGILFKDSQLKDDRQRLTFARKKIVTLIYPYLLWSVIFGIVMMTLVGDANTRLKWTDLPYQIIFDPRLHLWFLYALCLINLVVLGLKRFLPISIIVGLFFASQFVASWVPGIFNNIMSLSLYFVIGNALAKDILQPKSPLKSRDYGLLGLLSLCFLTAVTLIVPLDQSLSPVIANVFCTLGILTIVLWSYSLSQAQQLRWIKTLGKSSFYIYILHMLTWVVGRIILLKVFKTDQFAIHFVLAMFAGLVPPIALGHLAQRYAPWLFSADGIIKVLKRSKSLPL